MRDVIITVNKNSVIESCNPAVETIFGYELSEVIGQKLDLLIPHGCSNDDGLFFDVKCFTKKFQVPGNNLLGLRKNGTYFPIEVDVCDMDCDGKIEILLVIRDITQRKEVERIKNEFISTVSHELRTPLTSIQGSLGLISSGILGEISDEIKELVDIASNNSSRLIQLINDILDIENRSRKNGIQY